MKTVKITSDEGNSGYVIINETDFDPEQHQLYDPNATQQPENVETLTLDEDEL